MLKLFEWPVEMEEWTVGEHTLKMSAEEKEQLKELLAMKDQVDKEKALWRSRYRNTASQVRSVMTAQRSMDLEARRKCQEKKAKLEAALRECSESDSSQGSSMRGPREPGPSKPGPSK